MALAIGCWSSGCRKGTGGFSDGGGGTKVFPKPTAFSACSGRRLPDAAARGNPLRKKSLIIGQESRRNTTVTLNDIEGEK